MIKRPLSTLELTALGVIYKRGPCVAHEVVSKFAYSRTIAYKSGAGSVYPLLNRLEKAKLLSKKDRKYQITASGKKALKDWILYRSQVNAFTTSLDEIRSRSYFLKLLSPQERLLFISNSISGLQKLLESCYDDLQSFKELGDEFSYLSMLGAVRETECRINWLLEMKEALEE